LALQIGNGIGVGVGIAIGLAIGVDIEIERIDMAFGRERLDVSERFLRDRRPRA